MEPSIATKASQASNWATRGFTKAVRHEIGDFLQLVYFSIALIKKRLPPGADIENAVLANLRTRAEACKMLLDTAHHYFSPPELDYKSLDLRTLIADCVRKMRVRYQHLTISDDTSSVPQIRGDGNQLTQALNLLLVNACDAAQHSVAVKLRHQPMDGTIVLNVIDDGQPLPSEKAVDLFEPFTIQRQGRTGLGLAPAQRVVELHGGWIAVESLSDGLRVVVSLPEMPADGATRPEPAEQVTGDPVDHAATYQSH